MEEGRLKRELLKRAKEAFELASTLSPTKRIEVYYHNDKVEMSDTLEESEELLYDEKRVLCYRIYGNETLEDEIKAWIDIARIIEQPDGENPLPEPTDVELAIRDLVTELANKRGIKAAEVSSYEVFANLPFDLIEKIENAILEYWWSGDADDNAKLLAMQQIDEAVELICA